MPSRDSCPYRDQCTPGYDCCCEWREQEDKHMFTRAMIEAMRAIDDEVFSWSWSPGAGIDALLMYLEER